MTVPEPVLELDLVERNDALKFAARTRANLERIEELATTDDAVHPVTQLVNSLLGMLVFLREQKFLAEIENLSLSALCKRGWPAWQSTIDNPKTLKQLVRHMRNAIAHGRIRFSSDSKILAEVQFEFADRDPNTGQLTWQATIGGDALRTFVLRLVNELDQRIG